MTYDPSEEAGLRRDLPKTDPRMVDSEDTRATIWLPVAIATAPLIGLGHYFLRSDVEHEFPDARVHWRRNQASAEPELGRHRRKLVENPACAGFFRVALRCWHRTAPLIHCPSEISDVPAPFSTGKPCTSNCSPCRNFPPHYIRAATERGHVCHSRRNCAQRPQKRQLGLGVLQTIGEGPWLPTSPVEVTA